MHLFFFKELQRKLWSRLIGVHPADSAYIGALYPHQPHVVVRGCVHETRVHWLHSGRATLLWVQLLRFSCIMFKIFFCMNLIYCFCEKSSCDVTDVYVLFDWWTQMTRHVSGVRRVGSVWVTASNTRALTVTRTSKTLTPATRRHPNTRLGPTVSAKPAPSDGSVSDISCLLIVLNIAPYNNWYIHYTSSCSCWGYNATMICCMLFCSCATTAVRHRATQTTTRRVTTLTVQTRVLCANPAMRVVLASSTSAPSVHSPTIRR